MKKVGPVGIEPTTHGLEVYRSVIPGDPGAYLL